jgi:hypothetical protein
MSEYWWDRSGSDPDLERVEGLLVGLAFQKRARRAPSRRSPLRDRRTLAWLAAAAVALIALSSTWLLRRDVAWDVFVLAGAPTLGGSSLSTAGRWRPGEVLETGAEARAKVLVGRIGELDVEPGSRVRLVRTDRAQHRVALERGELRAFIWAPPRRFLVETPEALAADLGCAYSLQVEPSGGGRLKVAFGWVSFLSGSTDFEVYVPAGAACLLRSGRGAGTPYFEDASAAFLTALGLLDVDPGDPAALQVLLAEARRKDALSLLQVFQGLQAPERSRVCDRLTALFPAVGADCTAAVRGDGQALEGFWQALGIGGLKWWEIGRLPGPPNRP